MSNPRIRQFLSRRVVLGGLAAGVALPAAAQGATVEGASGRVTAANFAALDAFVARNVDKIVRMDVMLEPGASEGFVVEVSGEPLVAYARGGRTQVSVTRGGYVRREGGYAVEGFYAVRYAGMGQGITAIALEPAPEPPTGAQVRVTRL